MKEREEEWKINFYISTAYFKKCMKFMKYFDGLIYF